MARMTPHTDTSAAELLEAGERELDQAIGQLNEEAVILEPGARIELAQVYALMSIARSLNALAEQGLVLAVPDR